MRKGQDGHLDIDPPEGTVLRFIREGGPFSFHTRNPSNPFDPKDEPGKIEINQGDLVIVKHRRVEKTHAYDRTYILLHITQASLTAWIGIRPHMWEVVDG